MSTPRYNWWPFALNIIHDYPKRKLDHDAIHEATVTANMSGIPGGGGASRTTELVAIRELPPQEQREYDAVTKALDMQRTMDNPTIRHRVVQMTLIRNTHTIVGASMRLGITEGTVKRYRWEFILLVGCAYGFLDPEECSRQIKKRKIHRGDSHGQKHDVK